MSEAQDIINDMTDKLQNFIEAGARLGFTENEIELMMIFIDKRAQNKEEN